MSKDPAARSSRRTMRPNLLSVRDVCQQKWWSRSESNRRPIACKATALPTELRPLDLVGPGRLERPTLRLSGVRSNHLSYGPSGSRQKVRARVRLANADA